LIASPDNDYTYVNLDRLVEVGYYNDEDEEFTYDKLGNRETVKMQKGGGDRLIRNISLWNSRPWL